ncbi:lipocalin (plasmid) [Alloyangia pacifica]|uniref:Outer membrane lipoprotein Blc n=1 Tax=Alloyangia pacifica TaxID=311180 RepID=A0A2U8HL59_9RHOB|nr:lipocalin [Alloyangia pacifica]
MLNKRLTLTSAVVAILLAGCAAIQRPEVANPNVPEPKKPVELSRYLGVWYEQARFDHSFERDCMNVTAKYELRDDGLIGVTNRCQRNGETSTTKGTASIAGDPAKLEVTFFWPFKGDYWILDHSDDYSWSIVGEPSGRYLWFLTRKMSVDEPTIDMLKGKAREMGYDLTGLIRVRQIEE